MTLLYRTVLLYRQAEVARRLGLSRQYVSRLIKERKDLPAEYHDELRELIRKRIEEVAA